MQTRLLNPRIQLTTGSEVSVKSVADSMWFTLISPQRLQFLERPRALSGSQARYHVECLQAIPIKVSMVLGEWLRNVHHLVVIQLHAVQVACESNWILWKTSSAVHTAVVAYSLSIAFHLSRFWATLIHVSLFFISLPSISSVSYGLRNSLISSSHLFFGLPTGLYVWCLMLRLGFHSVAFFAHRSSGSDTILIAKRHSILLCAAIQHGILAAFILSTAVAVLLFMCSIPSSSSLSAVSVSSSVSFVVAISV